MTTYLDISCGVLQDECECVRKDSHNVHKCVCGGEWFYYKGRLEVIAWPGSDPNWLVPIL